MPLQDPPLSAKALRPPVILLTATLRWPIAARLAMAFAGLGCRARDLCRTTSGWSSARTIRGGRSIKDWRKRC
mgnify:CR=1 FL=1